MKRYKYLLANGCSFVKGDELKNESEERFSKLLSNRFGCEEINFGTSGGSNGETFRTTFDWIRNNQKKCKVDINDTPETLKQRVQYLEGLSLIETIYYAYNNLL